jgi:hypothetical protein
MDEGQRFRVEHRAQGRAAVVAEVAGVAAHHHSLAPFAAHLAHAGASGAVVLVDAASGRVVARRRLGLRHAGADASGGQTGRTPDGPLPSGPHAAMARLQEHRAARGRARAGR